MKKVPPYDPDAELSVVGAILSNQEAMADVAEALRPEDFYLPAMRATFNAALDLFGEGQPVDALTVADRLKRDNLLEKVGGKAALADAIGAYPTASAALRYAEIVKDMAKLRSMVEVGGRIQEIGYSIPEDVRAAIDESETLVFNINRGRDKGSALSLRTVLHSVTDNLESRAERETDLYGLTTGFDALNGLTGGFHPGQLIIVAGRPSMGKSAVLNDFAMAAGDAGSTVLMFTLEMGKEEIAQRFLAARSRVASETLTRGQLRSEDEWTRVIKAAGSLAELPIFVDDQAVVSLMEVRARARRVKAQHGLGLMIIDYLQLMDTHGTMAHRRNGNREQEIAEITRGMKILARELEVPVILAAQLNRSVELRADKRPILSDIRESGAAEQDADMVMFLYRPEVYDEGNPRLEGKAELILRKHRNGPTGVVHLTFQKRYTRFMPAAKSWEAPPPAPAEPTRKPYADD